MAKLYAQELLRQRQVLLPRSAGQDALEIAVIKFDSLEAANPLPDMRQFVNDAVNCSAGCTGAHHFGNRVIAEFWRLYDGVAPDFKLNQSAEMEERKRFTKRPLYVATVDDDEEHTVGGIWVDSVRRCKDGRRDARIHVMTLPAYRSRGIAGVLLDFFESETRHRYDVVSCGWGVRTDCDPGRFFTKCGYDVSVQSGSGVACKGLRAHAAEKHAWLLQPA